MNVLLLCRGDCLISKAAATHLKKFANWSVTVREATERGKSDLTDELLSDMDYVFAFRYPRILSEKQIKLSTHGVINFHPAPPKYRGSGAISHALYNEDTSFGVTAHLMDGLIDHGHIIGLREWDIDFHVNYSVQHLLRVSEAELLELFKEVTNDIYYDSSKLFEREIKYKVEGVHFTGHPHYIKEIDEMIDITKYISYLEDFVLSKKQLEKVIRATYNPDGKHNPYIDVHGYRFVLESDKPHE